MKETPPSFNERTIPAGLETKAGERSLIPVKVLFNPGPAYAADTRRFQGIPGVERSAGGRLWGTYYAGGPDEPGEGPGNYACLISSDDDGVSWSPPYLVIDPPGLVRAFDACLWLDPLGRLWFFWTQAHGAFDGRSGVWAMITENADAATPVWSEPRRLFDGIMMNKPTVARNGDWLFPVALWALAVTKPVRNFCPDCVLETLYGDDLPPSPLKPLAYVIASTDQGRGWTVRGGVDMPERSYDEHMLVERKDGSLWMLTRTRYGIGESVSLDGGYTWSPGRPSGIPHVDARFFIRRLTSGALLLITHNPPDGKSCVRI